MANHLQKIYLDYASTTPVDPAVVQAMLPYLNQDFGNPASIHWAGQSAYETVESARQKLAHAIKAQPKEIIFTSSATESNNLALKGLAFASTSKKKKIIISAVEHDCVFESARWLAKQGFELAIAPVDQYGMVQVSKLKELLDDNTLLVSVIHASNEIGTIQPIAEIGKLCRANNTVFHVDGAQTYGKIPIDVNQMKIDLLTSSAHKIYGPKGIAFLYKRENLKLRPLLHGGSQEWGIRSSTLNVPGIVGFAKALEVALKNQKEESQDIIQLRDRLSTKILKTVPYSYLNGHPKHRVYNILNFRFDFIEGESLALGLDQHGIAVSTGSACSSPKLEPSRVLLATGLTAVQAHGSLRISLGRWTTQQEVDKVIQVLPKVVASLREISPFKPEKLDLKHNSCLSTNL